MPGAFDEQLADAMAGRLRRDHRHVDVGPHRDGAEADVESVGEHHHVAGRQVRLDLVAIDLALRGVGDEDHHDVGPFRHLADVADRQARRLRLGARAARRRQADADADAAVLQVQRMRVPLRSVSDDRRLSCRWISARSAASS